MDLLKLVIVLQVGLQVHLVLLPMQIKHLLIILLLLVGHLIYMQNGLQIVILLHIKQMVEQEVM